MTDDVALSHTDMGVTVRVPLSRDNAAADLWQAAYGALDMARLHSGAPRGAMFACEGDATLRLLALRGVSQASLDMVQKVWRDLDAGFKRGHPWGTDTPAQVILPCCTRRGDLLGLVLLEWAESPRQADLAGLPALTGVLAALLWRIFGDESEVHDSSAPLALSASSAQSVRLRALLEKHEWNVSLVARVMSVTRMTIYNRMRALGIERVHIRKSNPRRRKERALVASATLATAHADGSAAPKVDGPLS